MTQPFSHPHIERIPHNEEQYLPLETGTFRVRDGRWLQWSTFGRKGGVPIVSFHGAPGSRGEASMYGPAAHHFGAEVLCVSRPGFGASTRQPGRSIVDFVRDTEEIVDAFGIDRFGVTGYSAGGPYALATAALLGNRVTSVNLLAPVAPPALTGMLPGPNVSMLFGTAVSSKIDQYLPRVHRNVRRLGARGLQNQGLPDVSGATFFESVRVAFMQGPRTVLEDWALTFGTWDFDYTNCSEFPIEVWQGRRDMSVPWRGTSKFVSRITRARLNLDPKANHFSVFTTHADEAISALVASFQF